MLEVEKISQEVINSNPAQYAFKVESGTDDFGTTIYRKEVYTVAQLESQLASYEASAAAVQAKLDAIADLEA